MWRRAGMGQVFRARDTHSGELVALKVLLGDLASHMARFDHERRALTRLSHPGIARYVAHGLSASGQPYLAMEWLEGEDLASRLSRGSLMIDESIQLAIRVAEALSVAHARDITPVRERAFRCLASCAGPGTTIGGRTTRSARVQIVADVRGPQWSASMYPRLLAAANADHRSMVDVA